jgi:hypothetical protein
MKIPKLKWLVIAPVLMFLGVGLFSGMAPDGAYRVFPGYFPDLDQWWRESPIAPQVITPKRLPITVVQERDQQRNRDHPVPDDSSGKQILFGDTHVHTTNSADAFLYSLPLIHGAAGAFPPAYACDYARFISQLDFYFLTDHAESFTPRQWRESIESVQQCNRLSGDTNDPDLVAFIGWEWTQVGATAESHYGHHNVLFKDDEFSLLPKRPIAAVGAGVSTIATRSEKSKLPAALEFIDPRHRGYYAAYNQWVEMMAATPACDPTLASPSLPADCFETAATPGQLFQKLDEWGFDHIVAPHGTSWGFYTPPGSNWEHQLNERNSSPERTHLIEVYSGHGNSEVFLDFSERLRDRNGSWYCPQPSINYLPACWQAGKIIRQRCLDEGEGTAECDQRAQQARYNFAQVDTIHGFLTVPGSTPEEWLDAGQARDVFLPAFNYRPRKSAQYGLALQTFDDQGEAKRFRWGFIASTDTHTARAGNGFKQTNRLTTTDSNGVRGPFWEALNRATVDLPAASANSLRSNQIDPVKAGIFASEFERTTSFMTAGGIAAVHAGGRNREAIWDAMKRREVYGTSGHRILLWFDLLNSPFSEDSLPMGSDVTMLSNPRFRVSAKGSFKQLSGCPDYVVAALEKRRLKKMASNECYNPSDERYQIARIEVVKIKPQSYQDEPVASLIEDSWRVFKCEPSEEGCSVEFSDDEFVTQGRSALYYVRVIEEPVATINANNLRTSYDELGEPLSSNPCYGDYRTSPQDDCQASASQRAWSSPIFVEFGK